MSKIKIQGIGIPSEIGRSGILQYPGGGPPISQGINGLKLGVGIHRISLNSQAELGV